MSKEEKTGKVFDAVGEGLMTELQNNPDKKKADTPAPTVTAPAPKVEDAPAPKATEAEKPAPEQKAPSALDKLKAFRDQLNSKLNEAKVAAEISTEATSIAGKVTTDPLGSANTKTATRVVELADKIGANKDNSVLRTGAETMATGAVKGAEGQAKGLADSIGVGTVLNPVVSLAASAATAVVGNKQVQDALGSVAEAFHKSGLAGMITQGLKSLDTEQVFNKSLASLGNVGNVDMSSAPKEVQEVMKKTQEAVKAATGAMLA